jgi:hypothetical protein
MDPGQDEAGTHPLCVAHHSLTLAVTYDAQGSRPERVRRTVILQDTKNLDSSVRCSARRWRRSSQICCFVGSRYFILGSECENIDRGDTGGGRWGRTFFLPPSPHDSLCSFLCPSSLPFARWQLRGRQPWPRTTLPSLTPRPTLPSTLPTTRASSLAPSPVRAARVLVCGTPTPDCGTMFLL